jgi:hypothetical protein
MGSVGVDSSLPARVRHYCARIGFSLIVGPSACGTHVSVGTRRAALTHPRFDPAGFGPATVTAWRTLSVSVCRVGRSGSPDTASLGHEFVWAQRAVVISGALVHVVRVFCTNVLAANSRCSGVCVVCGLE